MQTRIKRQAGFTVIEIIIVIVILGLLAATALPRFMNLVDEAEDASIDGLAGSFSSAVGLVRGQWELESRPRGNFRQNGSASPTGTYVVLDGVEVAVNGTATAGIVAGYPTGMPRADSQVSSMTHTECLYVLTRIMQSAPQALAQNGSRTLADVQAVSLFVQEGAGDTANQCFYYQAKGLAAIPAAGATQDLNGFVYNPATGTVTVFKNK